MVSCPLPNLRARGHAALSSFLAGTAEESRFHVLNHLINRCPWPNATGLLLDAFRREIDRVLRRTKHGSSSATELVSSNTTGGGDGGGLSQGEKGRVDLSMGAEKRDWAPSPPLSGRGGAAVEVEAGSTGVCAGEEARRSPFASALAGDVVCEQLRRACRGAPPTSLLMDMDSRTGGLTLARYAYALDGTRGEGESEGRLKLREPRRLQENRQLVQVSPVSVTSLCNKLYSSFAWATCGRCINETYVCCIPELLNTAIACVEVVMHVYEAARRNGPKVYGYFSRYPVESRTSYGLSV